MKLFNFILFLTLICTSKIFCSIEEEKEVFEPKLKKTTHTYRSGSTSFSYKAVTGTFPLYDSLSSNVYDPLSTGKALADLFFIAYFADGEPNRPITFVLPGGPGSSCQSDVLCTIGPRRLLLTAEGNKILPPYAIIDNPQSLLPWTDLVFLDPVTTGYSKFTKGLSEEEKRDLFSVEGDIAALSKVIESMISYFQKWNSPKYLSGCSYGAARCCGIANFLLAEGFSLHGLILLSPAIDYSNMIRQRNRPIADGLLIPTFAATAWFHGRLWPEMTVEAVVNQARQFVYEKYIPFMLQPERFNQQEWNNFYVKLAEIIGLEEETVRRYSGRFGEFLYTTEFMSKEKKVIGGLDTRYKGELRFPEKRYGDDDPSYRDMQGIACAFNSYLHSELETSLSIETPYVKFASNQNWIYDTRDADGWPDFSQRLRSSLIENNQMKVFFGLGYYDCRTPFAVTEFSFHHMQLPPSYNKNFQIEYYKGGHGFFFDLSCIKKMHSDLVQFYEKDLEADEN